MGCRTTRERILSPRAPDPIQAGAYLHPSGVTIPAGYPSPTNTGWAGKGVTAGQLVDATASWRYEAAQSGTQASPTIVVRKKWVNQDVRIFSDAHDITFRECDFNNVGVWACYIESGATRIRFEDCTFHGTSPIDDVPISGSDRLENGILSASATDWSVTRCDFYWVAGGIYSNGSQVTIEDSYFHDFTYWSGTYFAPNGDHTNASGPYGGSSSHQTYRHNSMVMVRAATLQAFDQTSCINFAQDEPTAYDDITVDRNFFVGNQGGHMILGYEPGKGGAPGTNFRVTNNLHSAFGTTSPPRAGYHGQPTWNIGPANNVWTGNQWCDTTGVIQGTLSPVTT